MGEAIDAKVHYQPCADPADLDIVVDVPVMNAHKEINDVEEGEHEYVLEKATVHIPRVGEAHPVVKVSYEGNADHVRASVSLDACGSFFGQKHCASELPGDKFPAKLLDIDHELGDLCPSALV